jgi:myosin heavy subunit
MERFARWSQTILETATKLLNITGGRAGGGPQGPSVAEMAPAGTANQQQELARVNQAITRLERERQRMDTLESMSPQGGDRLTQDRAENEERLTRARAVREQILEGIRATQGQADAQEKVTAEANKTKAAQEQTADAVKDMTKALDDMRKAEEAFKREAAAAPNLYGRPTGTPEEQERYLQERQSRLRPQVEAITKTVTTLPPGVTLPAELEAQARAYDTTYGQIGKSIDTLKEKEQAR